MQVAMERLRLALLLLSALAAPATAQFGLDFARLRAIVVEHGGRWQPLDTLAHDLVREVTGTQRFRGADPVFWLLRWTTDPASEVRERLIPIRSAALRRELGLPADRTVYCPAELLDHDRLHELLEELRRGGPARPPEWLAAKLGEIQDRLDTLQHILDGEAIRPIPDPGDALAPWRSIAWARGSADPQLEPVVAAWDRLADAFRTSEASAFSEASAALAAALAVLPGRSGPPAELIAAELRYNALQPFTLAWQGMALAFLVAIGAMGVRRRWLDFAGMAVTVLVLGLMIYGLSLRGAMAGEIPATNMYESLLWIGIGMAGFGVLAPLLFRQRLVAPVAVLVGWLALFLADHVGLDPFVRPIVPVLRDTVWMTLHVPVIMISYAILALGVVVAHLLVVLVALAPRRPPLADFLDRAHAWFIHVGSILLFVGIATGSMWAASSWGRYWGWDPKEVWSLVAFLGYMAIMHVRVSREQVPGWARGAAALLAILVFAAVLPRMAPISALVAVCYAATALAAAFLVLARGPFALAVKSILAFWLIIMTYVGVNFILGMGLHSYGFGRGAVAAWVVRLGIADLVLVAACCGIHLLRERRAAEPPAPA
ncbi:MAG: cytochrome c biogenesis protein CcsA [Planctomycetes bacterium]|nr:cytochrome c biogenesis protein CcsA [Planctomycetota bacterium]